MEEVNRKLMKFFLVAIDLSESLSRDLKRPGEELSDRTVRLNDQLKKVHADLAKVLVLHNLHSDGHDEGGLQ